MSWSFAGSWRRIQRALLVGFAIPVMPGAAVLLAIIGVQPLIDNWTYESVHTLIGSAVAILAAGCVLAAGLAADAWLSAPPERSSRPSPQRFLVHDRRSSLAGAAAAAVVVTLTLPPFYLVSMVVGDWLAHLVAAHAGAGPLPDGILPPGRPTDHLEPPVGHHRGCPAGGHPRPGRRRLRLGGRDLDDLPLNGRLDPRVVTAAAS
ncbi:hypothetical protein Acy02nite_32910 [Actinoplanes cyaneus]|uniref:Uncharacterized protein n=1 Tax=Actinoplanes cyaneus TaxID=52696 RepID=A0A919INU3_9ACTN|nr:hypothetical protein [Actinoplanes cyaneus]MCW2140096.1 hypothetical protein [Actinoplanes cyaneus]GID65410.1 hypothetical protein Acy02nite_32910 [Actinoplanes cyaneus]